MWYKQVQLKKLKQIFQTNTGEHITDLKIAERFSR